MASLAGELRDVLDRIAFEAGAGTITAVRGPSLVDLTTALWAASDRARAAAVHATGELNTSGELLAIGFVSTATWLKKVIRLSDSDARAAVAASRGVRHEFASSWEAWNSHDISGAAFREITVGLTALYKGFPRRQRRDAIAVAEGILIGVARAGTVTDVRRTLGTIRAVVDPDAGMAAMLAAYDDQSLAVHEVGAMFTISGYLTKQAAATVMTTLDLIIDGWYRSGSLPPEDQPTGSGDDDTRTRRRRRPHLMALALAEMARRQLESGDLGSRHEARPHIRLVANVTDIARDLPGELHLPGQGAPSLLPAESVRRILCDADITAVVTGQAAARASAEGRAPAGLGGAAGGGSASVTPGTPRGISAPDLNDWLRHQATSVLYVGRTRRTAPRGLRIALEIRDRHCAFPDCTVDTSRCEAHHVTYWRHHGQTALDNMALLCTQHHHLVHEGGWGITAKGGVDPGTTGYWEFTHPDRRRQP